MLAPLARIHGNTSVIAWLDEHSDRMFLPAIVLVELTSGIAKLRRLRRDRDASALDEWLASVQHIYAWRILPLDDRAAHRTGLLVDRARAGKLDASFADICIAGIAQTRGMTVLTRNLRHFAPLGVPAHDPCATLPG